MKIKILILLTIWISGCMSMFGQTDNAKVIKPIEATSADYIPLLNIGGYEAFPFDISSLLDGQYYITLKIKEYKDGNEGNISEFPYPIRNMLLKNDFPNEDQDSIKPEEMADPNRGIYTMARKMMIGFTPVIGDSIRPILMELENMGTIRRELPMFPQYQNNDSVNGKKFYSYHTKPFKASNFTPEQFIPLILYGSSWYDKNFGIHRFCGETEIDPDMSTSILRYIPHYYVIGIEVKPIKMLE